MMHTLKVVIIGECGVGKTSLRNQYTTSRFSPSYRATVGLDFHSLTLTFPPHQTCILQLWDTAGQDRFAPLSRAFFRGADAVLLVFDCTKPKSLKALKKWWGEFSGVEGTEGALVVAVGNKLDLQRVGEGVDYNEARLFLDDLLAVPQQQRQARERKRQRYSVIPASPTPIMTPLAEAVPKLSIPIPAPSPPFPSPESSPPRQSHSRAHVPTRRTSAPIPTPSASRSHFPPPQSQRSRSTSRHLRAHTGTVAVGTVSTLTSIATHPSIYHTPSSSLFDRLDGELAAGRVSTPTPPATPPKGLAGRRRGESSGSQETQAVSFVSGVGSEVTVTPSALVVGDDEENDMDTSATEILPEPLESALTQPAEVAQLEGDADREVEREEEEPQEEPEIDEPALFFTSSLDRSTVVPLFEYVARKVLLLREEEEERLRAWEMVGRGDEPSEEPRVKKGLGWVRLSGPGGRETRCCA